MNMKKVDISVVIPVYNAELLIGRCLDSIFQQEGDFTVEVIIIDDGSSDRTEEIIKNRAERESQIVFYKQKNSGPAAARNKGVEMASGRYIAYIDGDDYWRDGFLQKTYSFLEEHNQCVGVTVGQEHRIYGCDNSIIVPSFILDKEDSINAPIVLDDFYQFWSRYNHVCTGSALLRADIVKASGGQRVDMRICEDTEFWLLVSSYGKMGFIPEILFVSDGGAITAQQGWKKYVRRFQNIPDFSVWFSRLASRLTESQIDEMKGQLNGVVCGISRAKISGGDYLGAFHNLKHLFPEKTYPLIAKIYKLGILAWYPFAVSYQFYQYLKINKDVLLHKLHLK